jgi:hypothetical protein
LVKVGTIGAPECEFPQEAFRINQSGRKQKHRMRSMWHVRRPGANSNRISMSKPMMISVRNKGERSENPYAVMSESGSSTVTTSCWRLLVIFQDSPQLFLQTKLWLKVTYVPVSQETPASGKAKEKPKESSNPFTSRRNYIRCLRALGLTRSRCATPLSPARIISGKLSTPRTDLASYLLC